MMYIKTAGYRRERRASRSYQVTIDHNRNEQDEKYYYYHYQNVKITFLYIIINR